MWACLMQCPSMIGVFLVTNSALENYAHFTYTTRGLRHKAISRPHQHLQPKPHLPGSQRAALAPAFPHLVSGWAGEQGYTRRPPRGCFRTPGSKA